MAVSLAHRRAPIDPTPLYFRLTTLLRSQIESREYAPGSRLPAERQLATLHGLSRITVRQALDALTRDGLLRRGRGRGGGTFVREGSVRAPDARLAGSLGALFSRRQLSRIDVLAFEQRRVGEDVARALGLEPGAIVRYIERRLVVPAGPIAHVRNFLPLDRARGIRRRDLSSMLLHDLFVKRPRARPVEIHDEMEARLADARAAELLEIGVGRPLLRIQRLLRLPGEGGVNLAELLIASDRYRMTLTHRTDGRTRA